MQQSSVTSHEPPAPNTAHEPGGEGMEKLVGGSWRLPPHVLWLNGELKTIDVIREVWEIEDEWWRDHIARRYFDVVLDGGKHLIIYQDRLTGKWFAQTP